MVFEQLDSRPRDWNKRIQQFDTKTLFHEAAWLDHLQTIYPRGQIDYYRIADQNTTVGYFCALRVRKFLLPIYGSPLGGTGTNHMGPIVDSNVQQLSLLKALVECCRSTGVVHLEICNDWLDPSLMTDLGFVVEENVTHMCPLPQTEEGAWKQLRSSCRNRIRKAEREGLVAELTDDPKIVEHYFEQLKEVCARRKINMPYSVDRPLSLFKCLQPVDRLFAVWVKQDDRVVASGLFPHDERCVYFWGAGSRNRDLHLCPNELLHWTVMKLAISRGIPLYNMCGGTSRFKDKFGGQDKPYNHYSRSAMALLTVGRRLYRSAHFAWRKSLGRFVQGRTTKQVDSPG